MKLLIRACPKRDILTSVASDEKCKQIQQNIIQNLELNSSNKVKLRIKG